MTKESKSEIKSLRKDLADASALDAVALSEGGQKIIDGLVSDIIGSMETLASKFNKLSHTEFIGLGADMKNKMDIVNALKNAKNNKVYLSGKLAEALKKAEEVGEEEG